MKYIKTSGFGDDALQPFDGIDQFELQINIQIGLGPVPDWGRDQFAAPDNAQAGPVGFAAWHSDDPGQIRGNCGFRKHRQHLEPVAGPLVPGIQMKAQG